MIIIDSELGLIFFLIYKISEGTILLKKTACVPNIEICLFIFDGIVVRFDVTSGWLMLVDMVKYALFSFVICYFSKLVVY